MAVPNREALSQSRKYIGFVSYAYKTKNGVEFGQSEIVYRVRNAADAHKLRETIAELKGLDVTDIALLAINYFNEY